VRSRGGRTGVGASCQCALMLRAVHDLIVCDSARARFSDGRMVPYKAGDKEAKPEACAGVNGTTITVSRCLPQL
jgi:hypothetical protein